MQGTELNILIPGSRGGYGLAGVGTSFALSWRVRFFFFLFIVPETRGREPVYACKLSITGVWVAVCNGTVELYGGEVPCPGALGDFGGVLGVEEGERGKGTGASDIRVVGEEAVYFAFGLGW